MSNPCFFDFIKNLATDSLILKDYACISQACNASTWLGRVVHLFSSLGYSQSLILISELAQKYLIEISTKHVKPASFPSSHHSTFSEVKEEMEDEEDEEFFDAQKDEEKNDLIDHFLDDEEFARKLQQDEFNFEQRYTRNPLSHNPFDDEIFARMLQNEYDRNDGFPKRNLFSNQEEEEAKMLEEQFYRDKVKPKPSPEHSKKEDSPSEQDEESETEMRIKTLEGADQILRTPGLIACLTPEKEGDPTSKKVTVYELQSGLLRAVTAAVTKEYPHAISPAALRSQRDTNLEQYLAFKLKQFSHIEEVKGTVTLSGNKPIKLEGFFEVFATPMVISSFDNFSKASKFFDKKDRDWILTEFNKMIYCDYVAPKDIDQFVTTLKDPEFVGPLLIQSGFVDHCAAVMWVGDYLLYFDRSSIHVEPGIQVYHVPNRDLITDDFISRIVKREDLNEKNYQIVENFVTDLDATLIYHQHIPAQRVGNCTHATMAAVLEGLMAIRELLKVNKGKLNNISVTAWTAAFKKVIPVHIQWSAFERKVIFDDMMSEIEEWLTHSTTIGKENLKQTYQDLLTFWLMSSTVREPQSVKQVQTLLEALEEDKYFTSGNTLPKNP